MDQLTFSEAGHQNKKRKTLSEIFLERMDRLTKKDNQWNFGMKAYIGVGDTLGLIHSIDTTAANVHDIVPASKLLHGEERKVFGDAGYLGIQKRTERKHRKDVSWFIAKRPGTRKKLDADKLKTEKIKASIRAKVEHPFR
jgi:IS5 family transposase